MKGTVLKAIYVYMLRCRDGSYYVGKTQTPLERRIAEHNCGNLGDYTSRRRPVTLVWHQQVANITDAIATERQLKGWNRAKKEALIAGNFDRIRTLARRRGGESD